MPSSYILDGHKLPWHMDRVEAWERGEHIAPVTMDIALTSKCNARCHFCAARYQTGQKKSIPTDRAMALVEDASAIGVRGMVLMSDGESTLHPAWGQVITRGKTLGMDMAAASNGFLLTPEMIDPVLEHLTYLRINLSAGTPKRYSEIMGVPEYWFERVCTNIRHIMRQVQSHNYGVTVNLCMVCHPKNADQILPFARLGKQLGVSYVIIKHCLDYTDAPLAVDYSAYGDIMPLIEQAETLSEGEDFIVTAKFITMARGNQDSSRFCYGPAFLLQVSGTGLLAACGPMFAPQYADKFHIGNVCETRLYDLWQSPRYWEVMDYLRSEEFAETRVCRRYLCVQRNINEALESYLLSNFDSKFYLSRKDEFRRSYLKEPREPLKRASETVEHINFI